MRREVAEETGITQITNTTPIGMVLSNLRIPLDGQTSAGLILSVYVCEVPENSQPIISDEHLACDWFPPQKAATLLGVKYPKEFCDLVARL